MSWIERIKSNIEITTGDGKIYRPLYVITPKTIEYNVAEFEFPNIEGTLVSRSLPKGARHSLEIIFQGENHLDEVLNFEISAKDKRPWKISHPIYDDILVQPLSLKFDPTGLNTSMVTGEVVETITDQAPRTTLNPKDQISMSYNSVNETNIDSFTNTVTPTPTDIVDMINTTRNVYNLASLVVKSGDQANEYFDIFNKANSAILNSAANVSLAATLISQLYTYPSLFTDSVKNRLSLLSNQLSKVSNDIASLTTKNQKSTFEFYGASIVSAMINTAITPLNTDYQNANDVLDVINTIIEANNTFLSNLDVLQSINGGNINSYIPNYSTLSGLNSMLNYTISQLFTIALGAKQERILYLENDSNVILLAHRFYGLTDDDSTIDQFISQNNIGLNELLQIRKGRKLIYYV